MKNKQDIHPQQEAKMALSKKNYVILLIGVVLIVVGLILMAGGGSDSADEFNYAMFSWRRITLAPIIIVAGFAVEVYGILKRY